MNDLRRTDWLAEAIERLGDAVSCAARVLLSACSLGIAALLLAYVARECACVQELMWAITAVSLLALCRPRRLT